MNQQTIICSNCKTPNPARNLYCQSCGRPLIAASPYPTYPADGDATQPKPFGQQVAPVVPPYTPPQPPAYFPPPAPPQQEAIPPAPEPPTYIPPASQPPTYIPPAPEPPTYIPPAPQPPVYIPPAYIPPAPQPTVYTPPMQPQYPPPPVGGNPPAYPQQPGMPPTYPPAGAYQQPGSAQPDFFQKTQARAGQFMTSMKKETFHIHADGWSDLMTGEGEKAAEVEQAFVEEFNARELATVTLERVEIPGGLQTQVYQVVRHPAGSISVFANAAGKDLILGWDLNVAQKPSWKRMGILLLASLVLSFLQNLSIGYFLFITFLGRWLFDTVGFTQLFTVAALGLIVGMVMKGDIWYMFVDKPEAAAKQDLKALAMTVHQCLVEAVKKVGLDETGLKEKEDFKA